jgi:hypothetical protein
VRGRWWEACKGVTIEVEVLGLGGLRMGTAKLNGEMVELPNEELYEMIMSDSEELDTFQSETRRQPRHGKQRETASAVPDNI